MSELMNLITGSLSIYFRMMFLAPKFLMPSYTGTDLGVAIFASLLLLAIAVIFLCDWLVQKYHLGFTAGALLTLLILSLAVALTGLFMAIPSLGNASNPFLIVGIASPVFNIPVSVIASLGNQLKKKYPRGGSLFLCGVGLLFALALATTVLVFFYTLYNY